MDVSVDGIDSDVGAALDLERRELCPDGACLGVIGPDGRCKICGAVSPSGPPPTEDPGSAEAELPSEAADAASSADPEPDGFDLQGRELCPDGACLGVIGPDGRCKICGRAGQDAGGAKV